MESLTGAIDIALVRRLLRNGVAREIRERALLSQAELGKEIGVDHARISLYERGLESPRGPIALRYGEVLAQLVALQDVSA